MNTALATRKPLGIILFTWAVVLLISNLPNAIWSALVGEPPSWLFWIKVGLMLLVIVASLAWKPIQIMRPFFILLLVLILALYGMNGLRSTPAYHQWEQRIGWAWGMVVLQALKLTVAFIMILVLLLMGRPRKAFFFTPGELNAPIRARKIEAKANQRPLSWGQLGLILGICILPLTLLFFGLGNLPPRDVLTRALPFFPVAILFAATNAFSEEMQYRASLLGDLQKTFGEDHAIWMTAVFFGFAHYFGGPPEGVLGVLITGLLGALFAKCMLGSRGMVVPWFIHFCQNAVIYTFLAIGAVV